MSEAARAPLHERAASRSDAGQAIPLVRLVALSKTYGEGAGETPVLRDVDLELVAGETTSLAGASGSGKSTLLALIAGLRSPDRGTVLFAGQDLAALDEAARARLRARRIGVVLQSGNLVPFLSALENVELAIELAGSGRRPGHAQELLGELGLGRRLRHAGRRLSGGEAQRVAVAIALANDPDLLLADEVTGALDPQSAEQVVELIADASRTRGLTVLYVTHSRELAARADRRLRIADGAVHGE